ncbi:MAG TPA: hypothetical protein VGZ29_05365 [Terriglobia bacterium]|nr:hypothetical protein [Terriglobia bacterium]
MPGTVLEGEGTARGPGKGGIRYRPNVTLDEADVLEIHIDKKVSMRTAASMLGAGRAAEAIQNRGLR